MWFRWGVIGCQETAGGTLQWKRLNSAVHFSADERKRLKEAIWGCRRTLQARVRNICRAGGWLSIVLKIRSCRQNVYLCGSVHFRARPCEDEVTCEPRTQRHLLNISVASNSPHGWQPLAGRRRGNKAASKQGEAIMNHGFRHTNLKAHIVRQTPLRMYLCTCSRNQTSAAASAGVWTVEDAQSQFFCWSRFLVNTIPKSASGNNNHSPNTSCRTALICHGLFLFCKGSLCGTLKDNHWNILPKVQMAQSAVNVEAPVQVWKWSRSNKHVWHY